MSGLFDEQLIPIGKIPSGQPGRFVHAATAHRWRLRGVRGVKLRTTMVGGRRFTTPSWLTEFHSAVTTAADGEAPPCRTQKQREHAIAQAEQELREAGV